MLGGLGSRVVVGSESGGESSSKVLPMFGVGLQTGGIWLSPGIGGREEGSAFKDGDYPAKLFNYWGGRATGMSKKGTKNWHGPVRRKSQYKGGAAQTHAYKADGVRLFTGINETG